jgi:hypothetical protein
MAQSEKSQKEGRGQVPTEQSSVVKVLDATADRSQVRAKVASKGQVVIKVNNPDVITKCTKVAILAVEMNLVKRRIVIGHTFVIMRQRTDVIVISIPSSQKGLRVRSK